MSRPRSVEPFVRRMPKVELHVHLEGSIQPSTLLELARRRRVELPADDEEGVRRWFRFRDFEHFVEIYLTCCSCLRHPEDFQLVVDQLQAEMERQNVLYSEVHFTVGTHLANGVNGDEVADALQQALTEGERRRGVRMALIPDIVRNVGSRRADETLEWALAGRGRGVVALGLSGFESSPNEPYREHFRVAADEGLGRVAHAGEHAGPRSVRAVLEECGAQRIGHGVRSIEDPQLLDELIERRIPLEICPTSNLRLEVVPQLAAHPFDRLYRKGVAVTVNSDDPPMFATSLTDEYLRLSAAFGYGAAELATFAWTALRHAFLEPARRQPLEREFRARLAALGARVDNDRVIAEDTAQAAS